MKKCQRVTVLLAAILMIGAASASASHGQVSVTIPIGTYEIKDTPEGHEVYVQDFGRLLVPGKPSLPSRIFAIAIPPGAEVAGVTFSTGEGVTLPGTYQVSPVPLPRVIGQENPLLYERDRRIYEDNYNSVYGSDEAYPSSVVQFVRTAGYRKYNLADVRVTPFTYRPQSGELTYHPGITVQVSYAIPDGFSTQDIILDNLPRTEEIAREIVLNYDQAQSWYPSNRGGKESYDFVIITLDALTSSVSPLVSWELNKGRSVNVVTTSWINSNYTGYDLAEKMRNFLREKYPSGQWGIVDVLLVGHYDDVPMRRTWQDVGYGKPETDFYYAELSLPDAQSWDSDGDHRWGEDSDEIDFYAEVNVGRIPWSEASTVLHICQKSVAYEQNDDPAFKKNILLLGAFFWDDTDNAVLMEAKVDKPYMFDWTITRMYEQGYSSYPSDYNLTYSNVASIWSSGQFAFVNWAGHGSPYSSHIWYSGGEAFVSTSTCPSLNDNYPSIIFADACSNSDTDYPNIGREMLKQGGVGFLGATKVAFGLHAWDDPYDGSSQSLDYFFSTLVTSAYFTQGEAHQRALRQMYVNDLWYVLKYEVFEWGALWGNPNLSIASYSSNSPPEIPQPPSGISEGQTGIEYDFSSSTTDPEGDGILYLFNWGDGTDSDWLGSFNSGDTCTASHFWADGGTYYVKVRAKDVYDHGCDWSDSVSVVILLRGDCNNDGAIDASDVVYLINYLFKGGFAPDPLEIGDANCDGVVEAGDIVYLINYLFQGGDPPGC